jgi:hypothetical protein
MVDVLIDAVDVNVLEGKGRRDGSEGQDGTGKPGLGQHVWWWSIETQRAEVPGRGVVWRFYEQADAFDEKRWSGITREIGE